MLNQRMFVRGDDGYPRGAYRQPNRFGLEQILGRRRMGAQEFAPNPMTPNPPTAITPQMMTPEMQAWFEEQRLVKEAGGYLIDQHFGDQARYQPVPFQPQTIIPGAQATLVAQPSFSVSCDGLFIPSTQGPFLLVNNLFVGRVTQFLAGGGIGGEMFSEVSLIPLRGDTCTLGQQIELVVTNIGLANITVQGAAVHGKTAR